MPSNAAAATSATLPAGTAGFPRRRWVRGFLIIDASLLRGLRARLALQIGKRRSPSKGDTAGGAKPRIERRFEVERRVEKTGPGGMIVDVDRYEMRVRHECSTPRALDGIRRDRNGSRRQPS